MKPNGNTNETMGGGNKDQSRGERPVIVFTSLLRIAPKMASLTPPQPNSSEAAV